MERGEFSADGIHAAVRRLPDVLTGPAFAGTALLLLTAAAADGHWHVDSGDTVLGQEPPGPPVPGGAWETGCALVRQYEFGDPRIIRALYRRGSELASQSLYVEDDEGDEADESAE